MWPLLLDMTKEESIQCLRNLELEAYSHLISALRAQGPLNSDKRKLLKETGSALNISQERHKAEVRRALSDEKLSTIAYHINGQNECSEDWAQEGRRLIPLLPRMAPQTAYSAVADDVADNTNQTNKLLPHPSATERKRTASNQTNQFSATETSKAVPFRIPEPPKHDDSKKRKLSVCSEGSSLAQHLLGPSKLSRIQQIYRQKTKSKTKEQILKLKPEQEQPEFVQSRVHQLMMQKSPQSVKISGCPSIATTNGSKLNVLQNITLQPACVTEDTMEQIQELNNYMGQTLTEQNHMTLQTGIIENQMIRPKILTNIKSNPNITFKSVPSVAMGGTNEIQKTLKMCTTKKPITKTVNAGQKLIVVSNAQTIPSSSILQRTLSIPFVKNISVKNFEKFKIVTTTVTSTNLSTTVTNSNSFNSVKHKVVTVRTNPTTKKVFPLSHLQVLNKGSIKVLPLGGKIVGKTSTSTTSPLYIMNTMGGMQTFAKSTVSLPMVSTSKLTEPVPPEVQPTFTVTALPESNTLNEITVHVKSPLNVSSKLSVGQTDLVIAEDYDMKIEEFHIENFSKHDDEPIIEELQSENELQIGGFVKFNPENIYGPEDNISIDEQTFNSTEVIIESKVDESFEDSSDIVFENTECRQNKEQISEELNFKQEKIQVLALEEAENVMNNDPLDILSTTNLPDLNDDN